jgi:hypothetical protein
LRDIGEYDRMVIMKNKEHSKVLIVSCDYPYSCHEENKANIIVVLWFHNHIPDENGYMYDDGYIPISPYFIVKKNRYGNADSSRHIPLHLLPSFLENPSGELVWR